jgi:hypothetical protein
MVVITNYTDGVLNQQTKGLRAPYCMFDMISTISMIGLYLSVYDRQAKPRIASLS